MAREAIGVKRYVVRLSGEERAHLEAMLRKGNHGAKTLIKARILLKADVSEAGEGLSDGEIIEQLETSASMVYRVRKQMLRVIFRGASFGAYSQPLRPTLLRPQNTGFLRARFSRAYSAAWRRQAYLTRCICT
jgi:hypothetical protein